MLNTCVESTVGDEQLRYRDSRRNAWNKIALNPPRSWGSFYHKQIQHTYKLLIPEGSRILEIGCSFGDLLAALRPGFGLGIDFSPEMVSKARTRHPDLRFEVMDAHEIELGGIQFDYIVLSDVINDLWDIQAVLEKLRPCCHYATRLAFNFFSHLWQIPLTLAKSLRVATPTLPQNWLTVTDLMNLLSLADFELLRHWQELLMPLPLPGAAFMNRFLSRVAPFRWLALSNFAVARPSVRQDGSNITCSVVIAARNEEGHIAELLPRIPDMGGGLQIVFVEGNSSDDTYGAIERTIAQNPHRKCKLLKQPGKGKGDAVRAGFASATGDVLMILDADMSVPPENLPRFFEAIASGKGDLINGVRLVYPMENEAMRFLNLAGNKFFAAVFSWLLGQPIRDTLCGTKVIRKDDYLRLAENRSYFGDFDPFGDFDLLFGAAKLNLKIVEVPVRYRARHYGVTNIKRWRHGLLLLRMVIFAARRIKFV